MWNTLTTVTSTGFPGYYQGVTGWEDCANKCAEWAGANGEICEFWEYCARGCPLAIPTVKYCYFKKRGANCNDLTKNTNGLLYSAYKAGRCPSPSGSTCGSSKYTPEYTRKAKK